MRICNFDLSKMIDISLVKSRLGLFLFQFEDDNVKKISFPGDFPVFNKKRYSDSKKVVNAEKALENYLCGNEKEILIPFILKTNDTYSNILNTLRKIVVYGEVISYKSLAELSGIHNGQRVAAMAMKKNPLPLIFPCHRVIMSNGELGGYGPGIFYKKRLLDIEKSDSRIKNSW